MSELIITEKPDVAERIACALGNAKKHTDQGVRYYEVDNTYVVPAVGHIFGLAEKKPGQWTYPVFDIEWKPSHKINKTADYTKKYVNTIQKIAKKCDTYVNACDYDIEGEVIGYNALKYAAKADPLGEKTHRMKYSTLTKESIQKAYKKLAKVDANMADAGITRHILDWYWGINLSRALSLSARKANRYITLSIGRVQGPTLKFLTDREKSIRAFKSQPYWQLELNGKKEGEKVTALHEKDKFWEEKEAQEAKARCGDKAAVVEAKKQKITQDPPHPFDLTTLQTEAYKTMRVDPRRTLEVAQDLYTRAYISYPRTSSQKLPKELNLREIMEKIVRNPDYAEHAKKLLKKQKLTPNNGKKDDPAHPAIHPTGEHAAGLNTEQKKIYDLVVRRFLATFGEPAIRESVIIKLDTNGEKFISKGVSTVEPGWHILYGPYVRFEETVLPLLEKGDTVDVESIKIHAKETQPPKRYTPASIIREMEKNNIGTKATRSQIVDILYKRGYLTGKSIEVTELGISVVETMDKFCPEVVSIDLTRRFEEEVEAIQEGKMSKEKVVDEGRQTIEKISQEFKSNEKNIGGGIHTSITAASRKAAGLGPCPKCDEGQMVLRTAGHDKSQFIGCNNFPDCRFTMSLPKTGVKTAGKCRQCQSTILATKTKKPFRFCVNPNCPTKKQR